MAQTTPKELIDALRWIHETPHHAVEMIYPDDWRGKPVALGVRYTGHGSVMRVMHRYPWARDFFRKIRPNPRPHDDRMFAIKRGSRRMLRESLPGDERYAFFRRHP